MESHFRTCGDRGTADFLSPIFLPTCLSRYRVDLPSSGGQPFSATHFSGHCLGPNSCARHLRAFCFSVSSQEIF